MSLYRLLSQWFLFNVISVCSYRLAVSEQSLTDLLVVSLLLTGTPGHPLESVLALILSILQHHNIPQIKIS